VPLGNRINGNGLLGSIRVHDIVIEIRVAHTSSFGNAILRKVGQVLPHSPVKLAEAVLDLPEIEKSSLTCVSYVMSIKANRSGAALL
jgi:hypothetical protein